MAVFGFGRRNAVGRQYNGGNVSVMLPRYTTPPERNTRDWLEMFGRNPRLAVVDRIASDLSTCTGKLYRKDENGEEVEITDHPFLNFMAHPNPLYEMTSGACWRLQQIYLELKGEGYFVYEFDALGRPVELWPLPTHWVQQTPYVGYPYYEIRTTGGLIRQIPVDDIFCMKELNPLDPYKRGLGAAESLADEIETDEYAAKFQKKFFYNDATPTTLVSMPGSSKDQRDRFRSEWNERFRGPFNSHGIATVDGNVTVTKLAENMRDMDMTEGRRFLRDAVLEHFGVPREIMGITESSNRATSEAAQYIYAQNVIMPRLNRREEAINTQILPFYGNDLALQEACDVGRHAAVEQQLFGLHLPQQFFQPCKKTGLRLPMHKAAHRAYCHCPSGGDAVEAPVKAGIVGPSGGGNGADALLLKPCGEQLVAVVVPPLQWGGEVGVQRKVRPDDQRAFCQRGEIPLRLTPESLELVVVEEEMHPCALRVLAGQQLIEADEVIDPEGQLLRLGDGVARRGQLDALQQEPARQLCCPHPLVRKTHARPPVSLSQKA